MKWTIPILAFAAVSAPAQTGPAGHWRRPFPVDRGEVEIAEVSGGGIQPDRIVAVDFWIRDGGEDGAAQLPFASAVGDVEVRRFEDDGRFVVLAGGVREDLDIYVFDPDTRSFDRYPATGGRRLPSTFGDGLGSWPLCGADGLLLFAFEREEQVCFRAVLSRRTYRSRDLPLACVGFGAVFDPVARDVTVEFVDASGEILERFAFVHPHSPRLTVVAPESRLVDFGEVEVGSTVERQIVLGNTGRGPLRARPFVDRGFGVREFGPDAELLIGPDRSRRLTIVWSPEQPGEAAGALRLVSPVRSCCAEIELRGFARAPVSTAVAPIEAVAPPRGQAQPIEAVGVAPPSREPVDVVEPRALSGVEMLCRWGGGGELVVVLRVPREGRWPGRVAVRSAGEAGEPTLAIVSPDGSANARLAASALDTIEVAADGPDGPGPWSVVGRVPPALRLVERSIRIHAPPRAPFFVAEVVLAADGRRPRRVLRSWRGRADARGIADVNVGSFVGDGGERVHLVLAVPEAGGAAVFSKVLEIAPSSHSSRGDRAK